LRADLFERKRNVGKILRDYSSLSQTLFGEEMAAIKRKEIPMPNKSSLILFFEKMFEDKMETPEKTNRYSKLRLRKQTFKPVLKIRKKVQKNLRSITEDLARQIDAESHPGFDDQIKKRNLKTKLLRFLTQYMWCDGETFEVITPECGKIEGVHILELIDDLYDLSWWQRPPHIEEDEQSTRELVNHSAFETALDNKRSRERWRHKAKMAKIDQTFYSTLEKARPTINKWSLQKTLNEKRVKSSIIAKEIHQENMKEIEKWKQEMLKKLEKFYKDEKGEVKWNWKSTVLPEKTDKLTALQKEIVKTTIRVLEKMEREISYEI
jgi:hypothetical protein